MICYISTSIGFLTFSPEVQKNGKSQAADAVSHPTEGTFDSSEKQEAPSGPDNSQNSGPGQSALPLNAPVRSQHLKRYSVNLDLEKVVAAFLQEKKTERVEVLETLLHLLAGMLIAYGIYVEIVAYKTDLVEHGISFIFDTGIPMLFMCVSDTIFLELVATDILVHCVGKLCLFNGFMDGDEELDVVMDMLGLRELTGRTEGAGLKNLKKATVQPLESSKNRLAEASDSLTLKRRSSNASVTRRHSVASDVSILDDPATRKSLAPVLRPEVNAAIDSLEVEVMRLEECNEALTMLCDLELTQEERTEWTQKLLRLEGAADDVLHQL